MSSGSRDQLPCCDWLAHLVVHVGVRDQDVRQLLLVDPPVPGMVTVSQLGKVVLEVISYLATLCRLVVV